jgi:hypothetical protein
MATAYSYFHKSLDHRKYVWGKDYGTVIWYHDEWQTECRPDLAQDIGQLGCEAIEWAARYYGVACPHKGTAKIGKNWYETH